MSLVTVCTVCRSSDLTVTRELWDAIDRVVVCDQLCRGCGRVYLTTRKPKAGDDTSAPHHTLFFPHLTAGD